MKRLDGLIISFFAQNVNRMFKKYFNIAQNISEMDKTGINILWKRFLHCFGRERNKVKIDKYCIGKNK